MTHCDNLQQSGRIQDTFLGYFVNCSSTSVHFFYFLNKPQKLEDVTNADFPLTSTDFLRTFADFLQTSTDFLRTSTGSLLACHSFLLGSTDSLLALLAPIG